MKIGIALQAISHSLILYAAVCASIAAAASNCYAQSICKAPAIVAGHSLGLLTLGMPVDEALHSMGKPQLGEQTASFDGSAWKKLYYFPNSDFYVIAQDGKVVELALGGGSEDTRACTTSEGVRLGTRSKQIEKAYGAPDDKPVPGKGVTNTWTYDKKGISFIVDSTGGVLGVTVFTPGTFSSLKRSIDGMGW